jgi:DNA polymerase elongation subunit (family B)
MSYISAVVKNDDVVVWERDEHGKRVEQYYRAPYYFYIDDENGKYETIYGTRVSKLVFPDAKKFYTVRKELDSDGVQMWESDIGPDIRIISQHYYGVPAPKLHVSFVDIEVDYDPEIGFAGPKNPYAPMNALSIFHEHQNKLVVLAVPPKGQLWTNESLATACDKILPIPTSYKIEYRVVPSERELILEFLKEIEDTDLMCGWNSDFFDFPYIAKRIEIVLGKISLKRLCFPGAEAPRWEEIEVMNNLQQKLVLSGRLASDYMQLYKKYEPGERASYKLESISNEVLVDKDTKEPLLPKLHYEGTLADLYTKDFAFFIRYNIRDVEILHGFEQTLGYVELANQMYHLSGALFQHVGGTLKLAELAIVNYCHHSLKKIVNNSKMPDIDRAIDGAYVLLPQVGLHEWAGSVDINSLYPSAIRAINISPEMLRGQFTGDKRDAEWIAKGYDELITLELEDGTVIVKTAKEFRTWLRERKWAVSGYGTVFDQSKEGMIPAILREWYATRKKYQAMSKEEDGKGNEDLSDYYDRLQYVFKIKLNSLYGALTNLYFRFYDLRMGESTTGTGRMILKHQCRKAAEVLDGNYDVDFPLYETIADAMEAGYTEAEARQIALHGPKFNGKFQSESVIYGDTDSTYFKTHASSQEEATMIANAVADKINASYPEFMRETFLCNEGFDTVIRAAREIISDRGIFVDKKRYILHLVDKDGNPCDKMKVMGLDTKKTTLPKAVSDKLNGFIERLLKGETWEDVSVDIVAYKEVLINSKDIMDIGLPKGCNKVEMYTKDYELNPTTRLPGHISAAIYYNICLKEYGDKVSRPITSGTKIKTFRLKGNNHGRFKSIAIPTDAEFVPQWFLDNFVVDKEAHIERLVDNPLANILKAIGKEPPTKQSLLVESLFTF